MSAHYSSSVEIEGINLSPKTEEKCPLSPCCKKSEPRLAFRASTFFSQNMFFILPNEDNNPITKD